MKHKTPDFEIQTEQPYDGDAFDRAKVVEPLIRLIGTLPGNFVIAVDSPWGSGKTVMLKMLQARLSAEKHPCLYFNAWETDFADDPLIAFIGEMDELLKEVWPDEANRQDEINRFKKKVGKFAKRAIPAVVRLGTMGVVDLAPEVERVLAEASGGLADDVIGEYLKEKDAITEFKAKLGKVMSAVETIGKKSPVVILVDELDRCRPLYAIEMLERIKHVFNVENVVFVVAVDKQQLGISLGAVYGSGFNHIEYLRRFFDLELRLTHVSNSTFCNGLIKRMGLDAFFDQRAVHGASGRMELEKTLVLLSNLFSLSPRAQERCMGLISVAMSQMSEHEAFFPIHTAIVAVIRVAAEEVFGKLATGSCSVCEIIDLIERARTQKGILDSLEWGVIRGYVLAMRYPDRDARAEIYLEGEAASAALNSTPPDQKRIHEITIQLSQRPAFQQPRLKFIVERIDFAAQLFSD